MDQGTFQTYIDGYNRINQFCRANGMELEVVKPGRVCYHFKIKDDHLSSPGTAHGGILAAVMDATLGTAALTYAFTLDQACATVEFKINYLRPARLGDELIGEAEVDYTGKKIVVSSGDIRRREGGELIAKGMGTFNLYPLDKNPNLETIV